MGVSYTENYISEPIKCEKSDIIKEININAIYRSNTVYKECSYRLPAIKFFRTKQKKTKSNSILHTEESNKTPKEFQSLHTQYSWSKVYHSPLTEKQSKLKEDIVHDNVNGNIPVLNNVRDDILDDIIEDNKEIVQITTENVGTSIDTFRKPYCVIGKVKSLCKIITVCPCCTGGDDDAGDGPYRNRVTAASFESIDLANTSNVINPLHLDASILSIIYLHRIRKSKRTPKHYAKILRCVARNTYKNALYLLQTLK